MGSSWAVSRNTTAAAHRLSRSRERCSSGSSAASSSNSGRRPAAAPRRRAPAACPEGRPAQGAKLGTHHYHRPCSRATKKGASGVSRRMPCARSQVRNTSLPQPLQPRHEEGRQRVRQDALRGAKLGASPPETLQPRHKEGRQRRAQKDASGLSSRMPCARSQIRHIPSTDPAAAPRRRAPAACPAGCPARSQIRHKG